MSILHLSLRDFAHTSFDDFANLLMDAVLSHQFVPRHFALVLGFRVLSVAEGECRMWVFPTCIHTPKTSWPLPLAPCLFVGLIDLLSASPSRLCRSFAALQYECISNKR